MDRKTKDAWLSDGRVNKLGLFAQRFLLHLILVSDNAGRGCADTPSLLRSARCSFQNLRTEHVTAHVRCLAASGYIRLYSKSLTGEVSWCEPTTDLLEGALYFVFTGSEGSFARSSLPAPPGFVPSRAKQMSLGLDLCLSVTKIKRKEGSLPSSLSPVPPIPTPNPPVALSHEVGCVPVGCVSELARGAWERWCGYLVDLRGGKPVPLAMMDAQRRRFGEVLKVHGEVGLIEAVEWTIGAGFSQLVVRRKSGGKPVRENLAKNNEGLRGNLGSASPASEWGSGGWKK